MTAMNTELLTITQVANRLGISNDTARRWIRLGRIESINYGAGYRVTPEALERFIHMHEVSPGTDAATAREA